MKTYRAIRHDITRKKQFDYCDTLHHPDEKINQIRNVLSKLLKGEDLNILELFAGQGNLTKIYSEYGKVTANEYKTKVFEKGDKVAIYLDPPYWRSKKHPSMLYGINGNLHSSFSHSRFAENMKKCKHKWLITYGDSQVIRELFKFASKYTFQWENFYGMKNVNRKKAGIGRELFISNYQQE